MLAPADDDAALPDYVTSCGRPVPVRYNGSVARRHLRARRPRPGSAGGSRRAGSTCCTCTSRSTPRRRCWRCGPRPRPVVATFHSAMLRSRALHAAHPLLRPSLEKIRGRIAVSEDARATVQRHLGGEAFIIPNGVYVDRFGRGAAAPEWARHPRGARRWPSSGGSTSRARGSAVALRRAAGRARRPPGCPPARRRPGRRHRPAQGGRPACRRRDRGARHGHRRRQGLRCCARSTPTSRRTWAARASASCSSRRWRPVPRSSRPTCRRSPPSSTGAAPASCSRPGRRRTLAGALLELLADPERRGRPARGRPGRAARVFDWDVVADRIMAVYETVIAGADGEPEEPAPQGLWGRLVRGVPGGGS